MLIKNGFKKKKILGITRKVKAPNFHDQFGSVTTSVPDFDLNPHLYPSFDQNSYNTVFNTPAQPNGCTGMATASVMTNLLKTPINPYFCYEKTCQMEDQPTTMGCQMADALNEPVICGLLALGETTDTQALAHKTMPWWEVTPLNGSLFQGMISAMSVGGASISYGGTWWESYESPVNGIVPQGSGAFTHHDWVFSGPMTVNGIRYLIAESFLGANWGGNEAIGLKGGFCLFSEAEINANGGQAFTPKESPNADTPAPLSTAGIIETLINFLKDLLGIQPVLGNTLFDQLESEEAFIQSELDKLFDKQHPTYPMQPMNPIQPLQAPTIPATPSVDTLLPWNTTSSLTHENWHNVRVLCDLEGLNAEQKETLTACVWVESEFNTHAKRDNTDAVGRVWSTDNGICQWNTYFHGSEITPDQAINDPEMAVRLMCSYWKAGKESEWVSFTSGAYKVHMGKTL